MITTPIKLTKLAIKIFFETFSFRKIIEAIVVTIGVKKLKETASDNGREFMA